MDKDKLNKLNTLIKLISEDTVKPADIERFLGLVLSTIRDSKNELNKISSETLTDIAEGLDLIKKNHSDTISEIDKKATEVTSQFNNKLIEFNLFVKEVKKMRLKGDAGKDGKDGMNPSPEDVVPLVLEKMPKYIEETGETIADKLELLKGDKRLDASAIKNLPEATSSKGGSTARNLWQLHDVSIDAPANNEVLKYNSTTEVWENGTASGGTIDGSGTTNELTYWVDSDTLGALAVATYPSKAEIAHVKGVTSAIQTQLNGKQASMGADDNYVTDAEKVVIGNTSGTNTGDNAINTLYSGLVTNATHTGEVTGSGALTVDKTAITGKTEVTAVGTDYVLISDTSDSGNLKKVLASDLMGAGGTGITRSVATIAIDTNAGATALTDYVYFVTGTTTLTLPTAVGNTNRYTIKSISGTTTVDGNGVETIDGSANIVIANEDSVDLISNNTEWKVV